MLIPTLVTTLLIILSVGARAYVIDDMITWVQSAGGSFSDKLEIRRMDPEDAFSPYGVYAKEYIEAKESLMIIPHECYIAIHDAENIDIEDWEEPYHNNLCNLAQKLMTEMKLGEKSQYAPYIAYLQTQKRGQLPVNWSEDGKEVLKQFYPEGHQVVNWIDQHFKQKECIGDDPFEEHMVEMTVQRCFDEALIPIWDMVNHDNGRINTENDSMHEKDGLKVRASKDIEAGEQIYASYDKCVDCMEMQYLVGTLNILKDFGFVENYPHRYVDAEKDIWFEIHSGANGHFVVGNEYAGEDEYTHITNITETGLEFLEHELLRVQHAGERLLNHQGDIPDHEWDTIYQFYMAFTNDFHLVIAEVKKVLYGKDEL